MFSCCVLSIQYSLYSNNSVSHRDTWNCQCFHAVLSIQYSLYSNNSVSHRDTWNYQCFHAVLSIQYSLYSEYTAMGMGKNSLCFNMTHSHR